MTSDDEPGRVEPLSRPPNPIQNRQFRDAVREISRQVGRPLTKAEERRLHDHISGEGLNYRDIIDVGIDEFRPKSG